MTPSVALAIIEDRPALGGYGIYLQPISSHSLEREPLGLLKAGNRRDLPDPEGSADYSRASKEALEPRPIRESRIGSEWGKDDGGGGERTGHRRSARIILGKVEEETRRLGVRT